MTKHPHCKNPQDARFIKTKIKITKAIEQIRKRKSIFNITVSAICKKSKLARSTFYRHYSSLEDAIENWHIQIFTEFLILLKEYCKHSSETELLIFLQHLIGSEQDLDPKIITHFLKEEIHSNSKNTKKFIRLISDDKDISLHPKKFIKLSTSAEILLVKLFQVLEKYRSSIKQDFIVGNIAIFNKIVDTSTFLILILKIKTYEIKIDKYTAHKITLDISEFKSNLLSLLYEWLDEENQTNRENIIRKEIKHTILKLIQLH